ncbi:MAG: SHOCT domain-containing protein [Chloroflexi bacterium]|nr:SHOCT domain-containing protein [Chloroflexota bacterium]
MMGWDFGWGWGWMLFGSLVMVLFWGGLIALIVLAVRGLSGNNQRQSSDQSEHTPSVGALEILQSRYAKGEITRDEFEQIRNDLKRSSA